MLTAGLLTLMLAAAPDAAPQPNELTGSWEMVDAYEILATGERITTYGEHPQGMMMVDAAGRYAIQIYRPGRPRFAAGEKAKGTSDELRTALIGASTHFGRVRVDRAAHTLVFEIAASVYPNWEGTRQVRSYQLRDGVLTYAVPAAASGNGTIAWSVWRRVGHR